MFVVGGGEGGFKPLIGSKALTSQSLCLKVAEAVGKKGEIQSTSKIQGGGGKREKKNEARLFRSEGPGYPLSAAAHRHG